MLRYAGYRRDGTQVIYPLDTLGYGYTDNGDFLTLVYESGNVCRDSAGEAYVYPVAGAHEGTIALLEADARRQETYLSGLYETLSELQSRERWEVGV